MIAIIRKNLNFFVLSNTSPPVRSRSPPVSLSLSLHLFSTSSATQLDISPVLEILAKHDFPAEWASRVASELTHHENPEQADSVLSFLKQSGFSNAQLMKIVGYRPRFLRACVEKSIKPKFKILQDLGFSSDAIHKLISMNPAILHLSVDRKIIPSLSVMKGLFGSNEEVTRVLKSSPRFLSVNLENSLVPNIEFLKSCGISMESIRITISNFPNPFLLNPEVLRKSAEKVKEMGLDSSSRSFVYAIPTIASSSNEAWELKLQAFRNLGFSDSDILAMFRKNPRMFCASVEKIKKITELLLASGKFNISSIVGFPGSLEYSAERRLIPRLRILGILETRNLIKKWPSLATICVLSDQKFLERFISPHLDEISDVYITNTSSARGKKEDS